MSESLILFSALAAIAPIVCYISFFWWLDRYEREPAWLLILTFIYGGTLAILGGIIASQVLISALDITSHQIAASFVAPVTEEPAKGLILVLLLASMSFDNMTDGLLYGAATGLGFAATENFLYFLQAYNEGGETLWWQLVWIRGLFTALMHSSASALLGAALGWARHRGSGTILRAMVAGLLGAMAIHALFNGALVFRVGGGFSQMAALALIPLLCTLLFILTLRSLAQERRVILEELTEEAQAGVVPAAHPAIISSWRKRRRSDWFSPSGNRKRYVAAATMLAFRKHQQRLSGKSGGRVERDIQRYRGELRTILG